MILIVEKEQSIVKILKKSFSENQIKFITVSSGEEALKYLEENYKKVKVIITEIKLEKLNGIDLIKEINNVYLANTIQFIVVSQYRDYNTIRLAFKQQIFDFLERPINPEELLKITYDALKKQNLLYHNNLIRISNLEDMVDSKKMSGIYALLKLIGFRDFYTEKHCERVAKTVSILLEELNMSEKEKSMIKLAALLHDIGKIGIPDKILLKEGKLTDLEYETMKKHSDAGYEILRGFMDEEISNNILHHHEHYDGTGYPRKLKGDEIPLGARIIFICDVYDALKSNRPYRAALSSKAAIQEMNNEIEKYDNNLYIIFIKNINKINLIYDDM